MNRLLDLPRHLTWYLRHWLAAALHHWLTMPEYRYLLPGEQVQENDECRIGVTEPWHRILHRNPLIGVRAHAAGLDEKFFRRIKSRI